MILLFLIRGAGRKHRGSGMEEFAWFAVLSASLVVMVIF